MPSQRALRSRPAFSRHRLPGRGSSESWEAEIGLALIPSVNRVTLFQLRAEGEHADAWGACAVAGARHPVTAR